MKARSVGWVLGLWLAPLALVFGANAGANAGAQAQEPEPQTPPQAVPDDSDPRVDVRTDEQRREELRGEIPRLEDLMPGLDKDSPQIELPKEPDRPYPGPGDFLRVFREVPPLIPAKPEPQRPPDAVPPDAVSPDGRPDAGE